MLDARRGQAFAALYERDGEEVWAPLVAEPEELAGRLREVDAPLLAAGDGAIRFAAELEAAGVSVASPDDPVHRIAARHMCALGETVAGGAPERIEPIYLREPDAKRWLDNEIGQ